MSYTGDRPELREALIELVPLATHWKNIGVLLGVEKATLDKIKKDEGETLDCLREMLSMWVKQISPTPTWTALADIVSKFDGQKAHEIRRRCATTLHVS